MTKQNGPLLTRKAYREQKHKEKLTHRSTKFTGENKPEFHFKNNLKEYEPNKTRFYTREIRLDAKEIQEQLAKAQQQKETLESENEAKPNSPQEAVETNEAENKRIRKRSHRTAKQNETDEKQRGFSWGSDKMSQFLNIGITTLIIGIVMITLVAFFV